MLRNIIQIAFLNALFSFGLNAQLTLKHTIAGGITPKSIVHSGQGLFFAQNMIYKHTITVYDRNYVLQKKIPDQINLEKYGYQGGSVKGGPVECAFSHNGRYAWVSNYTMEGVSFTKPGCDNCAGKYYDKGFIYKVNTHSFVIEKVIEAGCVPKYVACSANNKWVLVSNWTSGDVTIINADSNTVERTIDIGRHPRGIVIDAKSEKAYITVMGSNKIAVLDLDTWQTTWINEVGRAPRHVVLSPDDKFLYCSINNLGKLIKIDLNDYQIVGEVYTGRAPRSMEITPDGQYLFVVNYNSNSISKVRCSNMAEIQEIGTKTHPIGITLDWDAREVWVACYSGYIQIFKDQDTTILSAVEPDLLTQLDQNTESLIAFNKKITAEKEARKLAIKDSIDNQVNSSKTIVDVPVENNFLPNTFIVVGSFSSSSNAQREVSRLKKLGYDAQTIASNRKGFTCAAIRVKSNPTGELIQIKQAVIKSAWIIKK